MNIWFLLQWRCLSHCTRNMFTAIEWVLRVCLVFALGSFHIITTVLAWIGKYLDGSGFGAIWTKNKVFGLEVVESVLSGSDYERSIDVISLLGDCIPRLDSKLGACLSINTNLVKPTFEGKLEFQRIIVTRYRTDSHNQRIEKDRRLPNSRRSSMHMQHWCTNC